MLNTNTKSAFFQADKIGLQRNTWTFNQYHLLLKTEHRETLGKECDNKKKQLDAMQKGP